MSNRKHSFVHRNATYWNNLLELVVNTPSIAVFEQRLDNYGPMNLQSTVWRK